MFTYWPCLCVHPLAVFVCNAIGWLQVSVHKQKQRQHVLAIRHWALALQRKVSVMAGARTNALVNLKMPTLQTWYTLRMWVNRQQAERSVCV